MLHDLRTPPDEDSGNTRSKSQDIACSVWLGQQRRRENGTYRLWGAILKNGPRHLEMPAGSGSHAKKPASVVAGGAFDKAVKYRAGGRQTVTRCV